ncbi:hypothetical protein [Sulfurimonas sp.]|uniref:hypothetical protein n=1 Tax=Sulfurimonas sp. TaxID=2022749 RepID=UPI0025CD41B9|nr:hypothetical protein [Sulfurimonas sp.]MDD5157904.1 hypothetical protein [Sulfurimonas sp.]
MGTELIIYMILGLVVVLAFLMLLLFLSPKKGAVAEQNSNQVSKNYEPKIITRTDLDYLLGVIKNKGTTTKELATVLDLVIKHHGVIAKKLGIRAHPDFDIYVDIILTICRHKNTNKNIVVKFDKELVALNPDYKEEINDAITKGLNSRGI